MNSTNAADFISWFRDAAPYIHAHRGQTFVVAVTGAAIAAESFQGLVHDLALLNGLGVRLVLVHGARAQLDQRLAERSISAAFHHGLRVTDSGTLECLKDVVGNLRIDIEASLSQGLANSPMAGAEVRVASGNFLTAKPHGVIGGVDVGLSGLLRRIDTKAMVQRLDAGELVVVSPLGYSPTGEVFNLDAGEVAAEVATALGAGKLIYLLDSSDGIVDQSGQVVRQITAGEAGQMLADNESGLPRELAHATLATRRGVRRAHLLKGGVDGELLRELFSRDGVGTLISAVPFDSMRAATIEDVGGILTLLTPLEQQGILVKRSREKLETEIDRFTVVVRDGTIIACGALYPSNGSEFAEVAALVVHPDYQGQGFGESLLEHLEGLAVSANLARLFALTTQTDRWFREHGYENVPVTDLPTEKQSFYNYQRNSKVMVKTL